MDALDIAQAVAVLAFAVTALYAAARLIGMGRCSECSRSTSLWRSRCDEHDEHSRKDDVR